MPNRLAGESSPYLLQHAANPVDWYPWGDEALARARAENKPIFLSIGYSACHWCHVMEHESFENAAIAARMNDEFVCIKVDREERPDLDQIYMNAVQLMTGRGGWPMSVFLTPDQKPFYGGTYWPPASRMGMPGFDQVLVAVADAWKNRRGQALEQAEALTAHLRSIAAPPAEQDELHLGFIEHAVVALSHSFDAQHGGFGGAPKFPHPMDLRLLARDWHRHGTADSLRQMTFTLDKMAAGGIYDQLGGGLHRYSVDDHWLVPHFEKMLYDNALLVPCYVEAYLITGRQDYAQVARETCDYVLRELTDAAGGFYSTQDADSEGVEGKFFVWTPAEVAAVLGEPAARTFNAVYDVAPAGNFEHGLSILHRDATWAESAARLGRDEAELRSELAANRARLFAKRAARVHPGLDDKVLVAWNGLMIDALTQAATALNESRYLDAARRAADFLWSELRTPDGRLLHVWRRGAAKLNAYVDDYACLANALVSLYEADFDSRWLERAITLADTMLDQFSDTAGGGFFFTAVEHETLLARQKDLYDNAVPSGNAMAALVLARLAKLTGESRYVDSARGALEAAVSIMRQSPLAAGQHLLALDFLLGPTPEIVILGDPTQGDTAESLAALRQRFIPNKVLACRAPTTAAVPTALAAIFAGKQLSGSEQAVYLCQNFACQAPRTGLSAAIAAWDELTRSRSAD